MNFLKRIFGDNTKRQTLDEKRACPDVNELKYFSICGFMRSGTNWTNNLLNLHPHIACHGEYHFDQIRIPFNQWASKDWSVAGAWGKTKQTTAHFETFVKKTMLECATADPATRDKPFRWLGDRSPRLLNGEAIRGARHFRLLRDGRDVLVSWTYLNFALKHRNVFKNAPEMLKKMEHFERDPKYFISNPENLLDDRKWVQQIARQWEARVRLDDEYIERTESGEIDARVMSIRYEDLHREVESVRRQMYQYLDLEPDIALPLDSGSTKTSSGLPQETPTNLYRKGVSGDWKNYFNESQNDVFKEIAGDMLSKHGYEI